MYTNENALKDLRKKSRSVLTVQTEGRGKRPEVYGIELAYIYFAGIVTALTVCICKRRFVRRVFLLSSSDCRRRRLLADK